MFLSKANIFFGGGGGGGVTTLPPEKSLYLLLLCMVRGKISFGDLIKSTNKIGLTLI